VLFGRDPERDAIGAVLEAARESRSTVLVLRGEAGAGKTALLEDARERADDMHLLAIRGVQAESELPFAGLHQLIRPALPLLERLPAPQRRALEGALGLSERSGDDRFLISAACLTLLSELAERRPVLCLVDDVQWIDAPSVDSLLFVARRIDAEGIALLFAAREGEQRRFEARELPSLDVSPLAIEAAAAVIERRASGPVAPSVRSALVRQAAGNALALVELPATLTDAQLAGSEPLPETLPLTGIEQLFLERVHRLPQHAQTLLLVAAADETGRLGPILAATAAVGADDTALDAAERSGLVSVHGTQIEFRHPLVRSAVYQAASSTERRAAHLALADALVEETSGRRVWHLAAAATGADETVASALEQAAESARERSGHAAAATALERAASLTPSEDRRVQRLYRAADASWQAGRPEHAIELARQALLDCRDPRVRADLLHLLGHIEHFGSPLMPAHDLLWDAARLVEKSEPAKAAAILSDAFEACLFAGEAKPALVAARRARELAPPDLGVADYLAELNLGEALFINGLADEGAPTFEHAVEMFERDAALRSDPRLATRAAIALCWLERCAEARTLVLGALGSAREHGAVSLLPYTLFIVAWAARRVGAWQEAVASATEGIALARELGQWATMAQCLQELSTLTAGQGAESECRAHVAEGITAADGVGAHYVTEVLRAQLGLLDLGLGNNERAAAELESSAQRLADLGLRLHELVPGPDLVEAFVRLGRPEDAREALALVRHGANPRTAEPLVERCRGLVADDAEFEAHFAESLALHPDDEDVFGKARTRLAYGERLRRARRRVEAREQLRQALETFETLGAAPWAERARAELRASGETARKRDPSTLAQLTPQELQVARLVAQGLSNKEVAAQLFLSPRTIDAHLRNIFAKLGITSRVQLVRLPLGGEEAAAVTAQT
jgi:DNA-binding CsgD family transcriptional regulator